jgi:UDP-glucose:(heptosyl)LPS alpha-1,3-glucosyltransferase
VEQTSVKIALVAHKYGGSSGGIERVVEELAKRLCRDHEIHVHAQSIVRDEKLPIHFHSIARLAHSWSLNQVLFFFQSYLSLWGKHYDVVHLHAPSLYRKGIITCHGIPQAGLLALRELDREFRKEIQSRQIRRFIIMRPIVEYNLKKERHKRVIAISSKIHEDLVSICNTSAENISLIPNGVDLARFGKVSRLKARQLIQDKFGLSSDHFIFLFVGNFFKRKGVQFLLPALAQLRNPYARLIIVGNPEGQNRWAKDMTKALGIENKIIFAGQQNDVENFYAASDTFVFPSLYEAFSLVPLEALASGLPVITSRTGGAADLIQEGENGFLLSSPQNIGELAEKMEWLLRHPELRNRMSEKAKEKASTYSWDDIAEKNLAIYHQVTGNGDPGQS